MEGYCSGVRQFVVRHCSNGSSQINGIDFYLSYSLVAHADLFKTNIDIVDMHRLTARTLDVINAFQNTRVPINERVCVSPPPYYLY